MAAAERRVVQVGLSGEGFRTDGWNDRPFRHLRAYNAEAIPHGTAGYAIGLKCS